MFGLGLSEICTIIIVIVIVLNPKDLPLIVRKLGKIYATIMREVNHLKQSYKNFEEDIKITDFEELEDLNLKSKKRKNRK